MGFKVRHVFPQFASAPLGGMPPGALRGTPAGPPPEQRAQGYSYTPIPQATYTPQNKVVSPTAGLDKYLQSTYGPYGGAKVIGTDPTGQLFLVQMSGYDAWFDANGKQITKMRNATNNDPGRFSGSSVNNTRAVNSPVIRLNPNELADLQTDPQWAALSKALNAMQGNTGGPISGQGTSRDGPSTQRGGGPAPSGSPTTSTGSYGPSTTRTGSGAQPTTQPNPQPGPSGAPDNQTIPGGYPPEVNPNMPQLGATTAPPETLPMAATSQAPDTQTAIADTQINTPSSGSTFTAPGGDTISPTSGGFIRGQTPAPSGPPPDYTGMYDGTYYVSGTAINNYTPSTGPLNSPSAPVGPPGYDSSAPPPTNAPVEGVPNDTTPTPTGPPSDYTGMYNGTYYVSGTPINSYTPSGGNAPADGTPDDTTSSWDPYQYISGGTSRGPM